MSSSTLALRCPSHCYCCYVVVIFLKNMPNLHLLLAIIMWTSSCLAPLRSQSLEGFQSQKVLRNRSVAISRKLLVHCSWFTVHFKWLVSFLLCGPVSLVARWFITMKNNFDFLLTCNPLVINYNYKLFWVLYVLLYTWLFCVANNLLYILKYWVFSLFMAVCTFYLKANGDNNTVSG